MGVVASDGVFVGVDVSKHKLDVAGLGKPLVVANDARGVRSLVKKLAASDVTRVVMEATGGCERRLLASLHEAKLSTSLVNPWRVRRFAEGRGRLAKTDPIDAKVLADYARLNLDVLRESEPIGEDRRMLRELVSRRGQLVCQLVANKNQRQQAEFDATRRSVDRMIKLLNEEIAEVEGQIQTLIDADEPLRRRQLTLESFKGVGRRTSRVLVAELPELGVIDRRAIASLVGVAPMDHSSGSRDGPRHIKGGRPTVRAALYMATLVAVRHEPYLRAEYERLKRGGKPKKVALVACMRKQLTFLNSRLRSLAPGEKARPGGGAK